MFVFKKFPSLENHYRENVVHKARDMGLEDTLYIITEKLHGANFSFHVLVRDGIAVAAKPAKRTNFIEDGESFYGCRTVVARYESQIKDLAERFAVLHRKDDALVVVYGELFGGRVQAGMSYPKEQDFAVFDLTVNELPVNKVVLSSVCDAVGVPFVPILGVRTSLTEALAFEESFESKLTCPEFNGPEENKEAEGIVIEPTQPAFFPCGSRVYFKKKTKRFLERGGNKIAKPVVVLNEDLQGIFDEALEYVTNNRFNAVVSKIGEVSIKDIGRLTGLMTQDILIDMASDGVKDPDRYGSAVEVNKFMKTLQQSVQNFIRPILLSV